ncbi:MAG: hypothetical protein EXQ48_06685 [Acidobacteria bacterium]|nr:hypothetical protein [Acidobacteriota bacterium]
MNIRCVVLVALALALGAVPASAETVTLFRVFLNDSTAVVSYGEYARVGDRIVFSMPIGAITPGSTTEPNLHIVNIPATAVNWTATAKYADAVRFAHYMATSAEADYATLTGDVAATLNAIVLSKDPKARLVMVVEARRRLASWPRDHYGYRAHDVQEMLGLLDEAISSMRAAAGEIAFAFDLVAAVEAPEPVPSSDVLRDPTPVESIAQAMSVARITDGAVDRVSLLKAVVSAIDDPRNAIPEKWAKPSRKWAVWTLTQEGLVERQYGALTTSLLKRATDAATRADVKGVEGVIGAVRRRDAQLGGKRPEEINALIAQVQLHLDSARRLRLVRDRWKERVGSYRAYLKAIAPIVESLARAQRDLDNIKRLAGSEAVDLVVLTDWFATSSKMLNFISVPDELKAAHALLVSSVNLADSAVRTRRQAVMSGELRSAWDASSAAAGSMMLFARAQEDMDAIVKLPQIR